MNEYDKLIVLLMAIEGKAKDIHYTCSGSNFYGNHLFADRIADGIDDFIDEIKETCILGHGNQPLSSGEYYAEASQALNGMASFQSIAELILNCLIHIENIKKDVARGDSKILDDVASKLQNAKGLLHIMLGN